MSYPKEMSLYLPKFIIPWCVAMKEKKVFEEKTLKGYYGLLTAIQFSTKEMSQYALYICNAFAAIKDTPVEIKSLLKTTLFAFKDHLQQQWDQLISQLDPLVLQKIQQMVQ